MSKHNVAIFVSGTGSNARVMIDYLKDFPDFNSEPALASSRAWRSTRLSESQDENLNADSRVNVAMLISSSKDAKALLMAAERDIPTMVLDKKTFRQTENLLEVLAEFKVDFLVLAGFLWLVPPYLVREFPNRIVNIHPALLPKYGGKGMYGIHVHRAVKAAGETESGITIHYVNEHYDEGGIIFQTTTPIEAADTPADIAAKVLALEHQHYSRVVKEILDEMD